MKIFLLITVLFFTSCKDESKTSNPNITPKGVRLANSTVEDSTKYLIDASFDKLFSDSRAQGYTNNLEHGKYTVYVKDNCITSEETGIKVFLVRADNYDGTSFDRNSSPGIGEVYAAEQVMGNDAYAICRDTKETMSNTVRYGAEHIILRYNDPVKYQETETHRNGQGHPIINYGRQKTFLPTFSNQPGRWR